jgi:cytochrome P450
MSLYNPAIIEDPYPHYAVWREDTPVLLDSHTGHWIISRHADVVDALKNHSLYSSAAFANSGQSVALPLLSDDPPRHTQLRALVNRAFTSRTLKDMEPEVGRLSNQMVNDVKPGSAVDIASLFTIPLPVAIISAMMGIPFSKGEDFKRWSDALTGTSEVENLEDRMPDIMEMAAFFSALIPERRANPGTDLVSSVANAEVDGEHMSDEDIAGFCMLLLIAGNETTTNLLSNLLRHCVAHPQLWQALRNDRSLVEPAIEEILRFDSPVQFVLRQLTQDLVLHGVTMREGDIVTLLTGSANRDPQAHERADEFQLERPKNSHLAFGHGIHFCIGAPLGRVEAKFGLNALLDKFSTVQAADQPNQRTHSPMLRGFHNLWLKLEAGT